MQEIIGFVNQHLALSGAFVVIFVLVTIIELLRGKRNTFNLSPSEAIQKINHDNAIVIDIRANEAYSKGHIINAESMTTSELMATNKKTTKLKGKTLIIVCGAGVESQKVAAKLLKQGYNAYSLAGGLRAWLAAQMPLVK